MATTTIAQERPKAWSSHVTLGMILFLVSEAFLFGSLFWTYYYLKFADPHWLPAHPDAILASINTAILLLSSGTIWRADRSIAKGNQKGLSLWLAITLALGVIFLGITVWEWLHQAFRPWTNAYGSIFYTLTGFHALHVFGGVFLMTGLLTRSAKRLFTAQNSLPVEIGSLYWHFVDFIWIFVFSTLFIIR